MASITLVEYRKLVNDPLTMWLVNEFLDSELLRVMPFLTTTGGTYRYDTVKSLPAVGFRGINEDFASSTAVINPAVEQTKIFGGKIEVDTILVDRNGPGAREIQAAAQVSAARTRLERAFIKGDSSLDPEEFDGLQTRITGSQLFNNGADASGNPLSIDSLHIAIDSIKVVGQKYLFCNDTVVRRIENYYRASGGGSMIRYEVDDLGFKVMNYRECIIIRLQEDNLGNAILPFTEASGDGTTVNNTSVYIGVFGPQYLTGLQNPVLGVNGPVIEDFGRIASEPKYLSRMTWDVGMAISNGRSVTRLRGIQDAPAVD